LDALGAAAVGLGVYSNKRSNDYYGEYRKLQSAPNSEHEQDAKRKIAFEAKYKKMQDTEKLRNVFYAAGGALLLGGVAVHIWF